MTMQIGQKIKSLRKAKAITQEQLAESLHISPQAVSKWENGIALPDITLAPAIARYFGITMDELFDYHLRETEEKVMEICHQSWVYRDDNPAKARAILEEGLCAYPDNDILLNNLLYTMDSATETDEIIATACRLTDITTQDMVRYDALRILAEAYKAKGDLESAVAAVEQLPDIYFTKLSVMAWILTGEAQYEAAQKQKWISFEELLQMMGKVVAYQEESGDKAASLAEAKRALAVLDAMADEDSIGCFQGYREAILEQIERLEK